MTVERSTSHGHGERAHPTERTYVKVAVVLAVVTAIEIAVSYVDIGLWPTIISLVALSIIKFVMVVGYFMHLKFDHPGLRGPFITGIVVALLVYTVVLANMVYHAKS